MFDAVNKALFFSFVNFSVAARKTK